MKKIITAVYDKKQIAFNFGIVAEDSAVQAIRNFEQACLDKRSILNMYPEDFTLYQLGEFETSTGKFKILKEPLKLSEAVEHTNSKTKEDIK